MLCILTIEACRRDYSGPVYRTYRAIAVDAHGPRRGVVRRCVIQLRATTDEDAVGEMPSLESLLHREECRTARFALSRYTETT